jgi:RES domain-containing protein
MSAFESWSDYGMFAEQVRRKARHVLDRQCNRFLKAVIKTSEKRARILVKGELLWRAQLGHDWRSETLHGGAIRVQVAIPYSPRRMTPLPDRAAEGRVNAKGIPCLYLSTDRDTAMSEVRPWIGSHLTVARFRILKNLRVVDCAPSEAMPEIDAASNPRKWEGLVWSGINRAFSEPISPSDNVADYAPTQVLAEAFRRGGYDGIVYRSALGRGRNIALFDPAHARIVSRFMFDVSSVRFGFSQIPTPPKRSPKES